MSTLVSPPPLVSGQPFPGPRLMRLPEEEVSVYSPGEVATSRVSLTVPMNELCSSTSCFHSTSC